MDRRDFLKVGLAAAAAGWETGSRRPRKVPEETGNLALVVKETKDLNKEIGVVPEYEKELSRVFLAGDLSMSGRAHLPKGKTKLEERYRDLFAAMPDYTEVLFAIPRALEDDVPEAIKSWGIKQHINYFPEPDGIEMWAQDYCEVVEEEGTHKFLVPRLTGGRSQGRKSINIRALEDIFGKNSLRHADFYFEGGNVCFDKTENGPRMFIGVSDVVASRETYKEGLGKNIGNIQAAKMISQNLGGIEVVVMGLPNYERSFFHIDQSFVLLADRTVVIHQIPEVGPIDIEKVKKHNPYLFDADYPKTEGDLRSISEDQANELLYMKSQFKALGYKVIPIEISATDSHCMFTSVNSIPYVEKTSRGKEIIFPVYPGEVEEGFAPAGVIPSGKLGGKAKVAYNAYVEAGYLPKPIFNYTYIHHGQTHCEINAIARSLDKNNLVINS